MHYSAVMINTFSISFFRIKTLKIVGCRKNISNLKEIKRKIPENGSWLGSICDIYALLRGHSGPSTKVYTATLGQQRIVSGHIEAHQCMLLPFLGVLLHVSNEPSYWANS